jgi:hypothetical protein
MIRSQSLNQLEKSTFQETAITGFLKTDDLEEAKRIGEENGEIAIYDRVEDRAIIL